jgi:hypothetical protein
MGILHLATRMCVVAAVSSTMLIGSAQAETYCGASNPYHDAPAGYLVMTRARTSIIKGVVDALGEYRTHTMLSHGGWFTHATMKTPSSSTDMPHLNPTQLRFGDPGASQISASAAYASLYGPDNGGIEHISKQQGGTEGTTVASWLWGSMPYRWVGNRCVNQGVVCNQSTYSYYDCNGNLVTGGCYFVADGRVSGWFPNGTVYWDPPRSNLTVSMKVGGGYYRLQANGVDVPYSLHQFADIGTVNTGAMDGDGMVCSTLQAYAVRKALGRSVQAVTYSHAQTAAAMNQFRAGVFNACKSSDKGFFGGIVDFLLFGSISDSKCGEAANQAINCMINPATCGDSGGAWTSARDNTSVLARSVSPDDISGWRPGEDYNDTSTNGPWAPSNWEPVSFSGAGATYACWGNG